MNYEETERDRREVIIALEREEQELYELRARMLPNKDDRFSSELARKTAMEAGAAKQQARVDALRRELELLSDRARHITYSSVQTYLEGAFPMLEVESPEPIGV